MVAVSGDGAEAILSRSLNDISVVLVHGSDSGLVSERVRAVVRKAGVDPRNPFQFVRLEGSDVASDPARLLDECGTVAMFGSPRVILISLSSADISPAVEAACQQGGKDWMLVIEAGAIKKDAAIRRFCDKQKYAVSIECNPDQLADLNRLLDTELASANIRIDEETRAAILRSVGADRMSTRGELAKLMLFADGDSTLKLEDVEAILSDASTFATEKIIHAAFSGDLGAAEESWKRIRSAAVDCSMILTTSLREATSLHLYAAEVERGGPVDAAMQRYRRTAFGRQPLSQDKLRSWTGANSLRAIEILREALKRSRLNAGLMEEIVIRALWSIAFLVGRQSAPAMRGKSGG